MSVIIDGALPRTEAERVSALLDEANTMLDRMYKDLEWQDFPTTEYKEYYRLLEEYAHAYCKEDYPFWHELEDEVIDLLNKLLPDGQICLLSPDDPGTVVIWEVKNG